MSDSVLITGGAGFIGTNLADHFLRCARRVVIFDDFSRTGSRFNAAWLKRRHRDRLRIVEADVRDIAKLRKAVVGSGLIVHLAAQVAVTTSLEDPLDDFDVNAAGTLHLLEAVRARAPEAAVIFTSTNKVYGGMEDVAVVEEEGRYRYRGARGISEEQPLDFCSPYGCSKGAADQYVRDYSRVFGLRTVVFRMSCIYGPHQFGNEEQGWVAHFVIAAMKERPIVIYGDGKQVRDVLYVDDLVRAFALAAERIEKTAGHVYNIGGGPENTVSVWKEFSPMLARLAGRRARVTYRDWRAGDQKIYVSDTRKAQRDFGWAPQVPMEEGIRRLLLWVRENIALFPEAADAIRPVVPAILRADSGARGRPLRSVLSRRLSVGAVVAAERSRLARRRASRG